MMDVMIAMLPCVAKGKNACKARLAQDVHVYRPERIPIGVVQGRSIEAPS